MNFIYALSDPRDNQIKYIGKSNNPSKRLRLHLNEKANYHKTKWIRKLLAIGLEPSLSIVEQVPDNQRWQDREKYWIKYYRELGVPLTNGTEGGDGGPDLTGMRLPKSEQGIKNIIASLVVRNKSQSMRERSRKTGLLNKGRKQSKETIQKKREYILGKTNFHTAEFKKKLAERNKSRVYDPEKQRANANKLYADPVKAAAWRAKRFAARGKPIKKPLTRKIDRQQQRANARKLWDDPIKGAAARLRLSKMDRKSRKRTKSPPPLQPYLIPLP